MRSTRGTQGHDQGTTGSPVAFLRFPPPSRSASMRCRPQPLCCGHRAGRTSPCGVSQPWGTSLAKGTVLGQATDKALAPFPGCVAQKGGGKTTLTQQRGSSLYLRFALVHVTTNAVPSPSSCRREPHIKPPAPCFYSPASPEEFYNL